MAFYPLQASCKTCLRSPAIWSGYFEVFLDFFLTEIEILRQNTSVDEEHLFFNLPLSPQNASDNNRSLSDIDCSGSKQTSGSIFYKFGAMCL